MVSGAGTGIARLNLRLRGIQSVMHYVLILYCTISFCPSFLSYLTSSHLISSHLISSSHLIISSHLISYKSNLILS
eukprot:g34209.t1